MKHLKLTFLLTILMSMVGAKAFAHDIEVQNADGVTIYYTWTNNKKELAVSYKGSYYNENTHEYIGNVVIPASVTYNGKEYGVTSIGICAFDGCSGLTSVTIPNSVTSIGENAFDDCSGLTSITIPNSVTSIGSRAFSECSGLTSVIIPNSVTSIGYQAFYGCSGLTSITIPNSVTSIGGWAFSGCTGLTDVTIPNSVTSIGNSAFYGCTGLTSVTIPNSVTNISEHAFYGCSRLTAVTIPNSVTSIGMYAFKDCSGLTSVTIPNSVTSIGYKAFYDCIGLTSVTIPNSVTSIGENAFYGTAWYDNQPDGLVYAGKVAYQYKGTMPANTSITLDEGTLGIADYAFYGCTGLTSVTIPNSVTSIGSNAFYGCTGLTSVTIPNSVTYIGEYAFDGCIGLTEITSNIQEPFATADCWYGVYKSIPLYVPYGTKEKYQNADGWKEFTNIIEMDETAGIESLTSDSSLKGEESGNIYSLDGRKVSNSGLSKGIYIKNGKKVVMK